MNNMYTDSMFDRIKQALTKTTENSNRFKNFLKLEAGNVYTVRLLPDLNKPEATLFKYFTHSWESFSTGQFISAVSPHTWDKSSKDPINEARFNLAKHGSAEEKEKIAKVIRSEKWLANIYVVNDPVTPANNGQVRILRFGKQIYKIIAAAIEGEDSDEFGSKIFDLSEKGCSLKIKVEQQGDFPTYVSSRFSSPSKVDDMTPEKMNTAYKSATDLKTVLTVMSTDDMKKLFDEHFHCLGDSTPSSKSNDKPVDVSPTSVDDIDPLNDDKVKELLNGLGS